jgi:hypothetical protein
MAEEDAKFDRMALDAELGSLKMEKARLELRIPTLESLGEDATADKAALQRTLEQIVNLENQLKRLGDL